MYQAGKPEVIETSIDPVVGYIREFIPNTKICVVFLYGDAFSK
jgi:hypothetical protein